MREGRWTVVVESGGLASAGGEGTPDFPSGTRSCGRGSPGFSSPASAAARITSMRRRPSCRPAPPYAQGRQPPGLASGLGLRGLDRRRRGSQGRGDDRPSRRAGQWLSGSAARANFAGEARGWRLHSEHPRQKGGGGTGAVYRVFFTGTLFGAALMKASPGLAVPTSGSGWPRCGAYRAGPGLFWHSEALSSFAATSLLPAALLPALPATILPPPRAFGSSLFRWGRGGRGDF